MSGKPYFWANQTDHWQGVTNRDNTLLRWAAHLQNDFRTRLDWCVQPVAGANHPPSVMLNGDSGPGVLRLCARPGKTVTFDARGTTDHDGHPLNFEWFTYPEAGTYRGEVALETNRPTSVRVPVPADAAGRTIHVVVAVTDRGEPPLTHYRRAVMEVTARAAAPPIPGLKEVPYLTNETLFSLTELPKRLGIIGAGPIGCEMAQSFARFGSEVFLVEAAEGILPREDRDASELVRAAMERDGVRILCCGKDLKVSTSAAGIHLRVDSPSKGYDVPVDQLLVAVGRAPNVEGLGLETVDVQFDKKGVKVNDRLQTTNPRIYACGDICSPYQFTHAADFMARIVIQNALFKGRAKASSLIIPWATYTSPEVAHVGLYEKDAKAQGIEVDTFTQELSRVDRAILDSETEGFVRVHVRKGTDEIVGATVVAAHAGDLIGELTLAMKGKLGLKTIGATIHPYPTQAEAIRRTGNLYNRTRLTPFVKNLMQRWLAWQR